MNATIPEFNMTIIEACLAVGVDYQDMATGTLIDKTIDEATLMQMELDEDFRRPGSRCSPAPAWIPASRAPSPATATRTSTSAPTSTSGTTRCSRAPCRCRCGRCGPTTPTAPRRRSPSRTASTSASQPFGLREYYDFPAPFGRGCVVAHDHEELSTLPRFLPRHFGDKGLKNVTFKLGFDEEALNADEAFVASGMASKEPVHGERGRGAADRRLLRDPAAEPLARGDEAPGRGGRDPGLRRHPRATPGARRTAGRRSGTTRSSRRRSSGSPSASPAPRRCPTGPPRRRPSTPSSWSRA